MALQPSQNPLEVVQSAGHDFIQYKNQQGSVLSWIDSNGIAQGALGGIQSLNVAFPFATIRKMGTTQATGTVILPGQGPNSYILPFFAGVWFRFGGTLFNNVTMNMDLQNSASASLSGVNLCSIGAATNDQVNYGGWFFGTGQQSLPAVLANNPARINSANNSPLVVYLSGAPGNAGNGSVSLQLKYFVIQF